jgi:hypothetical protein
MVRVGIEWLIYTKLGNKSSNPIEIIALGGCTVFLRSSLFFFNSPILTDAPWTTMRGKVVCPSSVLIGSYYES